MDMSRLSCLTASLIFSTLAFSSMKAAEPCAVVLPEQRCIQTRGPYQMWPTPYGADSRPATVSDPRDETPARPLTLNDALNIALQNSEVVRILTGFTASTSGRTIYDVAITNTFIDQERATFDPQLRVNNGWNAIKRPLAIPNAIDPLLTDIVGSRTHNHLFDFGLTQKNQLGGTTDLSINTDSQRFTGLPPALDPLNRSNVDISYTQPFLQGAGRAANRAPIVLARIDTERSYFQYKDSVQRLVQGVIEAYWALVFAKTDQWAREQQVKQSDFAYQRTKARVEAGDANAGELAQSKLALENFRASLLASQSSVLQRQAALLNILGLTPFEQERLTPVTPMVDQLIDVDWQIINDLAATQRPDIVELKLVLDADQQRRILADNQALARLDGVALYRWNGLEGEVPAGTRVRSGAGDFQDWTIGVNFSVPLGLRRERASLRQQQLIIRRDRANLEQGLHQMQHLLALSLRNLDQFYEQYERFQSVREAADKNLEQQMQLFFVGSESFIVVLQAIVDWGNSVSSSAQALAQYNTELATLELQTGSILESHGIAFFEERFRSIGPLGRHGFDRCYPMLRRPSDQVARYEGGERPSEENFDLEDPVQRRRDEFRAEQKLLEEGMIEETQVFPDEQGPPKSDQEIEDLLSNPTER
jgi:outer membrane protein TolC